MQITKDQLNSFTDAIKKRWPSREEINQRLSPKPKKIKSFAGENEIFRKGTVLVTDTRLAYIDPFDRMLKTYMFEHMISLNKNYYRTTTMNRRFCKALLLFGIVVMLITVIIDLLDNDSRGFVLVYIPALLSLIIGLLVWRDMRPKYRVEWQMRDGSKDKIATEPMFREWLMGSNKRELFMDDLAQAMNEALSGKAWWPNRSAGRHISSLTGTDLTAPSESHQSIDPSSTKKHLKLVTESYQ